MRRTIYIYLSLIVTVLVSSVLIIIITRYLHSSWDSPSGLILLGGANNPGTGEKILQNGGSSFELLYPTV